MRCFGVAPDAPKATMCEDIALAPAEVPPMTAPRRCASRSASPSFVPPMMLAEPELVAARHEHPGGVVHGLGEPGLVAPPRG